MAFAKQLMLLLAGRAVWMLELGAADKLACRVRRVA